MKKRMIGAAVLLVLLILIRGVIMPRCDIQYELRLPDGTVFKFDHQSGFRLGTQDSVQGHEGFGLPPVEHVSQPIYDMPGELPKDIHEQPRVITLTVTASATDKTRAGLHRIKAKLFDAMRWDRGLSGEWEPTVLRYTVNGKSRDLNVFYAGDITAKVGRYGRTETIGFRMVAYDPFWYGPTEKEQVLDWQDEETVLYFVERMGGLWARTITQPAAVGGVPEPLSVAIHPNTGDVYIAGSFLNWDNKPNADHLVRYDISAGVWEPVGDNGAGGPALNDIAYDIKFGPDGHTLYVGGEFTNAGGDGDADLLAQVDVRTDTWSDVDTAGGHAAAEHILELGFGHDGTLYIGGTFNNWRGLPNADRFARYVFGVGWDDCNGPVDNNVKAIQAIGDGRIVIGGDFLTAGGVGVDYIAVYDPDADSWADIAGGGTNASVEDLALAPDGTLYVAGLFTQTAGGASLLSAASWNGSMLTQLGSGLNSWSYTVDVADDGTAWYGGIFTEAGGLPLADRLARWNGYSWAHADIDLPGAATVYFILAYGDDVYLVFTTAGTAYFAGDNSVINAGNASTYPMIEVKNAGLLEAIENVTTGHELLFDLQILDGEIVLIDLGSGAKTITSNWQGNRLGDCLVGSDLGTFRLESYPRANHGNVAGANLISVFITDADARESGDNNNQLSEWEGITGIAQSNTDLGKLYVNIVFEGGANYHVDLYRDSAKAAADLVGHTGSYAGAGLEPIIEDNDSGLGGALNINQAIAADTDIEVIYTICTIFWHDRWWDVDSAIQ